MLLSSVETSTIIDYTKACQKALLQLFRTRASEDGDGQEGTAAGGGVNATV